MADSTAEASVWYIQSKQTYQTASAAISQLCRETYKSSKKLRARKLAEKSIVLTNCKVYDSSTCAYLEGCTVIVKEGKINQISREAQAENNFVQQTDVAAQSERLVIDCGGKVLLPESYVTAKSVEILEGMLCRGFTTVRDAGGADFGLAQAVEDGTIVGPRLLFTGHALSQTGGHGDFRGRGEDCCACGAALRGIGRVCDGDAEVRRAARDELRRGAHCIKIMASGGVASPTDRLTNTQFSMDEMIAIVEEAEAAGSYVAAHAYTPSAISRAVRAGVRSIEHGNYLDVHTAEQMAKAGTYLVPTLVTYAALRESGEAAGMPRELVLKVGDCVEKGLHAVVLARAAGVTMCFGSDLLGDLHCHQAQEFKLRAPLVPAAELLQSATTSCAALFHMEDQIGKVHEGMIADLILVDGDPLADIECLCNQDNILLVMKEGLLAKVPDMRMAEINDRLFRTGV